MAHAPTTHTIVSLGIVLAAFAAPLAPVPTATLAAGAPKPAPVVEQAAPVERAIFALDVDVAAYENTLAAFEDAGFETPTFLARFHTTGEACKGYYGLHVRTSDGVSTIHVCYTHERPLPQRITRERTLMHEVAHAWISQNVSETQMEAFLDLRRLTVWEGDDVWAANGAEHAAEILLWGVTDGERNINILIPQDDINELQAGYEILVGV